MSTSQSVMEIKNRDETASLCESGEHVCEVHRAGAELTKKCKLDDNKMVLVQGALFVTLM